MAEQPPPILIVDDDQDFLDMTRGVLEAAGYRVACACGSQAALEMMASEKPQLVIADLMMRAMDSGFALSRKIKEDPRFRDVPLIIVTAVAARVGYDFAPHKPEDLAAMHADAFFEKPVLTGRLLAKIGELLGRGLEEES